MIAEPPPAVKVVKRGTIPKLDAPFDREAEDHELADQVVGFYREKLKETPDALAYLQKRGLVHAELIDHFRLGFADRTLGYRLPQANRVAGAEVRGRLQALGFLRDSGHEHFRGSLVVPIFDENGHVAQCYGRKINDGLRKGTPMHLYLPGPHRAVWNLAALKACDEIILCESLIDAMTFWVHGFRNVTTSYGIRGFLKEVHLAAFRQHGIKRVLIAYDRDEPGEKAAADLVETLTAAGIETFRIQFPRGMDANSYACAMKPAAKALDLLIRSALPVGGSRFVVRGEELASGQAPSITAEVEDSSAAIPTAAPGQAAVLNQHSSKAAKGDEDDEETGPSPRARPSSPVDAVEETECNASPRASASQETSTLEPTPMSFSLEVAQLGKPTLRY